MNDKVKVSARELIIGAIDNDRLIAVQPPGRCEFCDAVKETRPYGPNGEQVCFPCGMKDEAAMKDSFGRRVGIHSDTKEER